MRVTVHNDGSARIVALWATVARRGDDWSGGRGHGGGTGDGRGGRFGARTAAGAEIGNCGGCEFDYGRQVGGDLAAWITVQKVSDLILNINVYMADVAARKLAFVHSVDIRGNTDESWTRGLTYLLKNYLLAGQ